MPGTSRRLNSAERRELDAIAQICRSRAPPAAFMRSGAERICRYADADSFCFSLLDGCSGLPAEVISSLDPLVRRAWIERVFQRSPLGSMGGLSRQPHPA